MKKIKGYKFIQEDMKSKNGEHKWDIGKWYKHKGKLELCKSGFHACLTPQQSLEYIYGDKWFIIEARGKIIYEKDDKFVTEEMRLVKEIKRGEEKRILNKYKKPLDIKKLEKDLGNIPTKKDVIKLIKEIDKIDWFKPQKPKHSEVKKKVKAVIKAFNLDFGFDVEYHSLNKKEAWDSARASARDSAWDSAWDSARASAWASAWDSAWDSARASARASEFEVVKDLMKEKGYNVNPFKELLELWKMGLYPVGILKDKKFHIYYVPLEDNTKEKEDEDGN